MSDTILTREKIQSQKAMIRSYMRSIYRYGYFLCRDKGLAEDLAQTAWVNIIKRGGNPDTKPMQELGGNTVGTGLVVKNFTAYARECVLNAYRDYLRASGARTGIGEIVLPPNEENRIYRIDDRADETVSSLDLRRALLQLGEEDRSLIYLKYYEGFSISEAAQEATGVTGGDAYRRHRRVLNQLRTLLTMKEVSG